MVEERGGGAGGGGGGGGAGEGRENKVFGEGKRQRLGNVNTAAFIHTVFTGQRADVRMNFQKSLKYRIDMIQGRIVYDKQLKTSPRSKCYGPTNRSTNLISIHRQSCSRTCLKLPHQENKWILLAEILSCLIHVLIFRKKS